MIRRLVTTLVLALVAAAGAERARADAAAVGSEAPAFEGREFINTPPVTFADLRGSVVVVELFEPGSTQCGEQTALMDELVRKYSDRGLVVLAVTNRDRKSVDDYVAKWKPNHAIVIESGDSSKTYGLAKGYPTAYVIAADGKIAWSGNWVDKAEPKIDAMLPKGKRSPRLPARLAAVRDVVEAGRLMEARRTLEAEKKAGTVAADEQGPVAKMIEFIDAQLTKQLLDAAAAAEEGKYHESAVELERLAKECADHDVGRQAADGLKKLLSDPARKREVDAGRQLAAAIESAKSADTKKAIALYKAVISKWKDTRAAKDAAALIAALEKPAAEKPK